MTGGKFLETSGEKRFNSTSSMAILRLALLLLGFHTRFLRGSLAAKSFSMLAQLPLSSQSNGIEGDVVI